MTKIKAASTKLWEKVDMWLRTAWFIVVSFGALIAVSTANGQALHDIHEGVGVPCAACHQGQQEMTAPPDAICVACHGTMIGEEHPVMSPDPHRSPHLGPDEIPACNDCHKIHGESEVTCVMCHRSFEFKIK
ncbi:cytochrome c3 family protein [Nitratireductor mangrovi]|uniref:Cytochrome c3 family protein n=1 Tax=Nitratireductor mangrovi TaxID=2599600 RepID=A0A5B8L1L5_9HYPH|nr:cytochrome c3 family protein [Nitratireductor mangrovi]QDZ01552.1 cytochrome c3 family protein [Nitratireductor mangrovi]